MAADGDARTAHVAAAPTGAVSPTPASIQSVGSRSNSDLSQRTSRSPWAALLAGIAAVVTLLCWAASSPPGSSPDEFFHLNSIWCAQGAAEGRCKSVPDNSVTRIVPHQVATPQCFTGNGAQSAGCRVDDYDDQLMPDTRSDIGNWRGGYPPVYYAVMSLFVQDTLDESVTVMRIVNATLVVLLVGGLAWLLPRRLRVVAPVTFVITAVPLA